MKFEFNIIIDKFKDFFIKFYNNYIIKWTIFIAMIL